METTKFGRKFGAMAAGAAALLITGGMIAGPASAFDAPWQQKVKDAQNNKNVMRTVGIGLGAAAVYEALQGKGTNAILLGAGAAVAGSQYEKDRKAQDDHNWQPAGGYRGDNRYDNHDNNRSDSRYDNHYDNRNGSVYHTGYNAHNDYRRDEEQRRFEAQQREEREREIVRQREERDRLNARVRADEHRLAVDERVASRDHYSAAANGHNDHFGLYNGGGDHR